MRAPCCVQSRTTENAGRLLNKATNSARLLDAFCGRHFGQAENTARLLDASSIKAYDQYTLGTALYLWHENKFMFWKYCVVLMTAKVVSI